MDPSDEGAGGSPRGEQGASDLKRRIAELERENQRKEDFVAVLGHELRNPLAAIATAAQLQALIGSADPRMQRTREVIERQTRHMTRLIDDLLDVSRIARGKIRLDRSVVDLRPLLRSVADDHRAAAEQRSMRLSLDLPNEPLWANVDPTRIVQVVANLVHNALKHLTKPVDLARIEQLLRERAGARETGVAAAP